MVQKGEFNSVGENSVQLCTNPCPPFMTILMMEGCLTSTGGPMSLCSHLYSNLGTATAQYSLLPLIGLIPPVPLPIFKIIFTSFL